MIVSKNDNNNTIEMINISKISGKNIRNLIKDYNVTIDKHYPLKQPSFAKANTLYKIEYFKELEKYICFGGKKLNDNDLNKILLERQKYIKKTNKNNVIKFTKQDFIKLNKIEILN